MGRLALIEGPDAMLPGPVGDARGASLVFSLTLFRVGKSSREWVDVAFWLIT